MKKKTFKSLMAELELLSEFGDLGIVTDHVSIDVDEISFTLLEGRDIDAGSMRFFCDFGAIPVNSDRTEILQRLLEANLLMSSVSGPVFSINFETDHALLIGRVEIENANAKDLLKTFSQFSSQAKLWRQNYFLEGKKKKSSSSFRHLFTQTEN